MLQNKTKRNTKRMHHISEDASNNTTDPPSLSVDNKSSSHPLTLGGLQMHVHTVSFSHVPEASPQPHTHTALSLSFQKHNEYEEHRPPPGRLRLLRHIGRAG